MNKTHKPIHPAGPARLTAVQIKECLLSPEDCPREQVDFLRQKPFAVIRQLAEEEAAAVLSLYLKEACISEEICRRFLTEEDPTSMAVRLTLMQAIAEKRSRSAEAAEISRKPVSSSVSAPESAAREGSSSSSPELPPEEKLRYWIHRFSIREPSLRVPLNAMGLEPSEEITDVGTDGVAFYYRSSLEPEDPHPDFLDLQHMVIHCLFKHIRIPVNANPEYWHTAADLSAEYLRSKLFAAYTPSGKVQKRLARNAFIFSEFPESVYPGNVVAVYQWLCQTTSANELQALGKMFRIDDHSLWKKQAPRMHTQTFSNPDGGGGDGGDDYEEFSDSGLRSRVEREMARLWNEALEMKSAPPHQPRRGTAPGSRREKMILREKAQFDFRKYLRRYSVIQEELQLDMDSFDYIPYTMGLRLYGNMPLLEPLEYTEAFKVEQLVIAIDTSGSCDTATVQRFLAEIQNVLTNHDNFFKKMEVHILQCDSYVHEHKVIHSVEEWNTYIRDLVIRGRGGTDFSPVFRYVEKLQKQGECQRLKGLIYFTDGDGVYPKKQPPYETAFAFSNWNFKKFRVPDWIIRLCLLDAQ